MSIHSSRFNSGSHLPINRILKHPAYREAKGVKDLALEYPNISKWVRGVETSKHSVLHMVSVQQMFLGLNWWLFYWQLTGLPYSQRKLY